ncbi:MAG: oligosaccharide flippase family protein [Lachnospiraceae bacterium]|nr:oligosaccharide flippase family protein [Lachnospiraceae bacterium]
MINIIKDYIINKVVRGYKNLSAPAKASLFYTLSNIMNNGVAFLSTPFFTRILSQEEYGTVSLYYSWFTIISVFATFQFPSGVFNKAMIKYEDDRDGYTSSMLTLTSLCTAFLFGIYILTHKFLEQLVSLSLPMVTMMFLDIFLTSIVLFWTIRERFEFRYKAVVIVSVGANVLATIVSLLLTIYISGDKAFLKILGVVSVHLIIYSYLFFVIFRKGKKIVSREYWKYSFAYNLPLIPHYLSQQVLNQSDRIMIDNICGKADTAAYSLAYQIAIVMQIITSAIHASFMPWTFQKLKDGEAKEIGKRAVQIELMIGLACVVFPLFAPEFVYILGGEKYHRAIYIIPPVAMSVLFITIYDFFGNIEFYFEKTKFVMVASTLVAVANLVLNALMIPVFGFVAAGYTTLICYILYSVVHYIFMRVVCRQNNIEVPYNGVKVWGISIAFTILSVFVSFIYDYFVLRYCFIVVMAIIVAILLRKNKDIIKQVL